MITKLQDSSVKELAGGVATVEYPDQIPAGVVNMLVNGPAGDHSPIF